MTYNSNVVQIPNNLLLKKGVSQEEVGKGRRCQLVESNEEVVFLKIYTTS